MPVQQGDVGLLQHPAAHELLESGTAGVRITIKPEWVGLLDFQTRFPSALPL
jgi:hypothetical protein